MTITQAQSLLASARLSAASGTLGSNNGVGLSDLHSRLNTTDTLGVSTPTSGASFAELMTDSLNKVNDTLVAASAKTDAFLREEPGANLVETMVAVNKAQVSFRTVVEVRNQLIQAYKDVANMPI